MAFPAVQSVGSLYKGQGENHPVGLPSGIQAGNLLLAVVGKVNGRSIQDGGIIPPSGWTQLFEVFVEFTRETFVVAFKYAAGGESGTVTFNAGSDVDGPFFSGVIFRLSGADPNRSPTFDDSFGSTGDPNPPSHTADLSADILWFAPFFRKTDGVNPTLPSGYGNYVQILNDLDVLQEGDLSLDHFTIGVARRARTAQTEDPGIYNFSGFADWVAATIAVYPTPPPPAESGGASASVSIAPEGSGTKNAKGGSEASVTVTAEGDGRPIHIASGGGEATVSATPEGAGDASEGFPRIAEEGTPYTAASGTSHAIPLPSFQAGDRLIVFFGVRSSTGDNPVTPTGWGLVASATSGVTKHRVIERQMDGTEGSTVTFTTADAINGGAVGIAFRLADDSAGQAPDGSPAGGTQDPPNHTAARTDKILWFATLIGDSNSLASVPTNYSLVKRVSAGDLDTNMAIARRSLEAGSEDPGAFGGTSSQPTVSTVAVYFTEDRSGSANASVTTTPEGEFTKDTSGAQEASVLVVPEGEAEKGSSEGSETSILVTPEGEGAKGSSEGTETSVIVTQDLDGFKGALASSEVEVTVELEEAGFPEVITVGTPYEGEGSSHPIPLPSGIQQGDLLLAITGCIWGDGNIVPPAGWTELFNVPVEFANEPYEAAYKIADGTESGTAVFTVGDVDPEGPYFSGFIFRIARSNPIRPPTFDNAFGTGSPNPPPHTAAESGNLLWFAPFFRKLGINETPQLPAGYGDYVFVWNDVDVTANSFLEHFTMACARRARNIQTEDPGTYVWPSGGASAWAASTIAVYPLDLETTPKGDYLVEIDGEELLEENEIEVVLWPTQ